ncbi:MAG: ArnT family glycosyltransferase [Solirubrobacteraceae bacterium]
MDASTLTPPVATPAPRLAPPAIRLPRRWREGAVARAMGGSLHRPALALLLIVSLLLRLWGIKQGLPYSYNSDEAQHFVPRAVAFFTHDFNPHYFLNPPAYSYLLHIVFELWFGSADAVARAYTSDPTQVFVVARVVAAVLGTAAVWLTYLAGARFFNNRTIGLLAAAVLGFAFLPVFYSHLALNDVPTLAPVSLALYGTAGVMRRGRLRDYAIAGAGVGLAAATKYTGGITILCLLTAFVTDASGGSLRTSAKRCAIGLAIGLGAFLIANPYAILDFSAFSHGVNSQASLAAGEDPVKLGSHPGSGIAYYLWTFTWGLGWGPTIAAIGGAVLLIVRRRIAMVLTLLPAVIAFIIFMGDQQRFFGRWLMPIFPIIAILAAYAGVELIRWLTARRVPAPVAGALVAVLLLAQSLVAVIHNDAVLSRPDTRNLTRAWMVAHVPVGSKVVIEPEVPDSWSSDIGRSLPSTLNGQRWSRYPTWLTHLDPNGNPLPPGQYRYVVIDQYERNLYPALLDSYVARGYCWVVLGSLQAGRAFAQPNDAPQAVAYYAELANRAKLVYHVSPFPASAHPVPFSFDWSIDFYPRQYDRPGPEMSVYRLSGGKCS